MKCPKCDQEMRVEVYVGVEVDKCPACEGIFLDRGEMETLISGKAEGADSIEYTELSNQKDMELGTCPRCHVEMLAELGPNNLRIDRCPKCDAVFLDQGELAELVDDA